MKKDIIIEGTVKEVRFPNRGIIEYHDEKSSLPEGVRKIIVRNAIPGQHLKVLVYKVRKGRGEAFVKELLAPSPLETNLNAEGKPLCPIFRECGGCIYLTLPYEEQLKIKEQQVRDILQQVIPEGCGMEPILGSPEPLGYRNKMEFSFGNEEKGAPLTLGLHRRGGIYDILPVTECRIADPDFSVLAVHTLEFAKAHGWTFYDKHVHTGFLRHLVIRRSAADGQMLINIVTSSQGEFDEEGFLSMLLELSAQGKITGSYAGILHSINDSVADMVASDQVRVLYGRASYDEQVLGLKFKVTPFSFFQTNTRGAEVLYSKVREYAGNTRDQVIFDLYCGTGTITQLLAPVARRVIGIEINAEAVGAARENAARNGLHNCEFIAGDVKDVIDGVEEKPDMIVVDPPREGMHPKVLQKLIEYGTDHIIYVSCKPTSLAEDLKVLIQGGYQPVRICPVDQFPATANVETVVLLTRQKTESGESGAAERV